MHITKYTYTHTHTKVLLLNHIMETHKGSASYFAYKFKSTQIICKAVTIKYDASTLSTGMRDKLRVCHFLQPQTITTAVSAGTLAFDEAKSPTPLPPAPPLTEVKAEKTAESRPSLAVLAQQSRKEYLRKQKEDTIRFPQGILHVFYVPAKKVKPTPAHSSTLPSRVGSPQ